MKLLFIWHAAADPHNRPLFDALIRRPGVEALVLTLPRVEDRLKTWRLARPVTRRDPRTGSSYRIVPGRTLFTGTLGRHFYLDLRAHLRRFRPDLIHLASGEAAMAVAFMTVVDRALVARDLGRRIPILLHMFQNIRVDYRWPWPVIERFVLRRVDSTMAYSPGARTLLRSRGVRGPIAVQPYGVDARLFRAGSDSPVRRRMGPGAPVIGWVGRMHFAKGLHLLLEASARMRRPHRLLVVGDGPRRAEERARAARLGLDRRTTWLPPQPTERMPAVYRAMDIYVHPAISRPKEDPAWRNWKEQFARTLPEAMLSGCAVVGSTSGEIPWVLGGTGTVVPERSPAALARALDRLVASKSLRHRMGARARARALTHFTFDAAAEGLLACWRSLL